MEAWIPITIFAAFCQNLRSALQKHLKGRLSTTGATSARFVYAFPFAVLYATGLGTIGGLDVPSPNLAFAVYGVGGALAQIVATAMLVHLFSYRNFAVGNAYSKTDTAQTALFGIFILGDPLSAPAVVAILACLGGVVALSVARTAVTVRNLVTGLAERPALIGIGSGAFFGVSAVCYRAASLSLGGEGFVMQAAFTLACVTVLQTIVICLYMVLREPGELGRVLGAWRVAMWVGVSGMAGSAGWFTAMTIQNAAYVRALGQIELVFTFVASVFFFRERTNRVEVIGILAIVSGILILLLGR